MEIKDGKAAVLDDTGVVHAVKDKSYTVGQILYLSEVELKRDGISIRSDGESPGTGHISRFTRVAAAALAVIIIGGSATAYAAPVSTVTIADGEETVEYRLNLFDRVVGVEAADDADESFKAEVHELSGQVRGMKITDAMDVTAERVDERRARQEDAAVSEMQEISVRVGGLKRKNISFNERLDHKASEIRERRLEEWRDMQTDESHLIPAEETMEDGAAAPAEPEQDIMKNEMEKGGADVLKPSDNTDREAVGRPGDGSVKESGVIPDNAGNVIDHGIPEISEPEDINDNAGNTIPSDSENGVGINNEPQDTGMSGDMYRPDMPRQGNQMMPEMSGGGSQGFDHKVGGPGAGAPPERP